MIRSLTTLKSYFERNDYPTQEQFSDFLETMFSLGGSSSITPFNRTLIVDKNNRDYVADGSASNPFKQPQDCVDYIASKAVEWNRNIHTDIKLEDWWLGKKFNVDDPIMYPILRAESKIS